MADLVPPTSHFSRYQYMHEQAFDYLIVGAGTAGCVLANRLSENPKNSVCLINAGGTEKDLLVSMPLGCGNSIYKSQFSWPFYGAPEPHLLGRRLYHPRGIVLGGSSSINGMVYIRGQHQDYDDWASANATGWGWADCLPYFIKSECQAHGPGELHGDQGPIHVEDISFRHFIEEVLIQAGVASGLPLNTDFNGESQEGIGRFQATIHQGKRCSAASAYLRPAMSRKNLTVLTNTFVEKVIFSGNKATALTLRKAQPVKGGVSNNIKSTFINTQGSKFKLSAGREIILSAGTFQSPQILQLSGIGPESLLRSHQIEVIYDAPEVGLNLHDHVGIPMAWELNNQQASLNYRMKPPRLLLEILKYLAFKRGIMTLPAASVGIFTDSKEQGRRPDLQFHCLPLSGDLDAEQSSGETQLMPGPGLTIMPYPLRPKSRGHVRIISGDAKDSPEVLMNYFSNEEDLNTLVRGMRIAQKITETKPLADFVKERVYPAPEINSAQELGEAAKTYAHTGYHPVGTCRMGSDSDSVVDLELKVRGVSGLRVVDASVMPTIVSGNTNAATLMIAEKIADKMRAY